MNKGLPPSGRNDKAPYIIGVGGCGAAANPHPSSPYTEPVIPNDSEESAKNKIPPFGRNDGVTHGEVPPFGRNDGVHFLINRAGEGGAAALASPQFSTRRMSFRTIVRNLSLPRITSFRTTVRKLNNEKEVTHEQSRICLYND
jgi:hypothetical protein